MHFIRLCAPILALVLAIGGLASPPARGEQSIVESVLKGCANELRTYCKAVSPGRGRIASCLYAYEDKLSLSCAVAVYNGIVDLQTTTAHLEYYAQECGSDLLQYCGDVVPGGGRLYQCLAKNKATLTDACRSGLPSAEEEMRKLDLTK